MKGHNYTLEYCLWLYIKDVKITLLNCSDEQFA